MERENLKTRPAFASDISQEKGLLRELYNTFSTNKNTHIEPFSIDSGEIFKLDIQKNRKNCEIIDRGHFLNNYFIMFDYDDRNPLNYEAKVYRVEVE
jgi:hypothetical protein